MTLAAPVSLLEKRLCAQEKANSLINNTINQVRECMLSSIDNDTPNFEYLLHQTDRSEFTKVVENEFDAH